MEIVVQIVVMVETVVAAVMMIMVVVVHNENKIYPDLYYAIPAIVSLIVELLRPV